MIPNQPRGTEMNPSKPRASGDDPSTDGAKLGAEL